MSHQSRDALQNWAKLRKTTVSVTSVVDPFASAIITTTVRCPLVNMTFNCQKCEDETLDECEERAAAEFLEAFVNSPVGRRRN